ncbi:MAG: flagellar basal body P-ring formation chaperone FlgA, partial [Halarsenatibacteraceae bacterium]
IISDGNVKIKVSSQELSVEVLFNKVEQVIKNKISDNIELKAIDKDFNVDLELISGPGDIVTPAGDIRISIAENIKKPARRLNLPVEIYVDDNYWKKVFMTLRINYQMEVYVLETDISRNKEINKNNLILKYTEFDFHPTELVLNLDNEIISHGVTRRNYQQGDILKVSMLEYPDIISFNQEVIAEFEQGSVYVTTRVQARENGSIGEIIEVENIDTGRIIKAEILNENRVRIIN